MHKTINKGILGRVSIWVLVAVMLVGLLPMAVSATEISKNTTAITAVLNGVTSVSTTTEFAKAAGDVRVKKINLTNNLDFSEFQQYARKTEGELVVDGGGSYSIKVTKSDWWQCSTDPTNHVSMQFKEGYSKVTFQNLALIGEAFNGFVYVKEGASLVFDNVGFDGPALAYIKNSLKKYYSTVTIKDSHINLRKRIPDSKDSSKTSYLYPSEAVEIGFGDVILSGNVSIVKEDPKNKDLDHDELFYFKEKEGNLIVEPGAVVDINNYSKASGSAYWSGLIFAGCCLGNINFTVGENAKFSYNGEGGTIVEEYGLTNFNVAENAVVKLQVSVPTKSCNTNLTCDTGSYIKAKNINIQPNAKVDVIAVNGTLYARESVVGVERLNVMEDATFRVISPANNVSEVAMKMHGKSPSIYLDRPDEVLLYNGNKLYSAKSSTNALQVAGACDGLSDTACADIAFTFIGGGISTWNAVDDSISLEYDANMDIWTPDPAKATTWTTSVRTNQFTLSGAIAKKDSAFLKPVLVDTNNYLQVDTNPENNPATGIKCFLNKSVIQFNGSSAPPESPKVKAKMKHLVVGYSDKDEDIKVWNTDVETGDGVEPVTFEFDLDKYASSACVFIENDYPRGVVNNVIGTRDNLKDGTEPTELLIDGNKGYLTVYPDAEGKYPDQEIYFAWEYKKGEVVKLESGREFTFAVDTPMYVFHSKP